MHMHFPWYLAGMHIRLTCHHNTSSNNETGAARILLEPVQSTICRAQQLLSTLKSVSVSIHLFGHQFDTFMLTAG